MNGCYDCGLPYSSPAWIEIVVPDEVWKFVSPTGDEGGLLCANCLAQRCVNAGLDNVPAAITAGPLARTEMGLKPDARD